MRGGKWKRRFFAALLLLPLSIFLLPILLAQTPLRNWLFAAVFKPLAGEIHIGGASLGWFRAPLFTDIDIHDDQGRLLLHAPRIEGDKSLALLLCHPFDLGEFRLTQPALHVVCRGDSTNVETTFAYWLRKKSRTADDDGPALEGVAVRAELTQASLIVEDEDSGRIWTLDPVDVSVAVPRDRRTALRFKLNAVVSDADGNGHINADLSARLIEAKKGEPFLRGQGEIHAQNVPLAAAQPFLRRLESRLQLAGRLSANLTLQEGDGQADSPDARLQGDVSIRTLTLSDPLLGADTLKLAQVDAPYRLTLKGSRLSVEQLEVRSDVGKVNVAGVVDLNDDIPVLLRKPGYHLDAEVNLARLAELAPKTLHLTKEAKIASGTLTLHLHNSLRDDSLLWEGGVRTSDLQGQYQGQRLVWKEPLAVAFAVRQEGSGLPRLEHFQCDADFLHWEISGSLGEWTSRGRFNLDRLSEHLAGFVDLGSIHIGGKGSMRLAGRRNPRGGYRLEGDLQLNRLSLADAARTWVEDNLTLRVDLVAAATSVSSCRIDAGGAHLLAGKDGIDVDLLEPIADVRALRSARARLRVHGDLKRWHDRIHRLTGMLHGVEIAGQLEANGRLRYESEVVQLEDVKVVGHAVRMKGFGLCVNEPSLDLTTSGRWLPARQELELQHTRLSCPTATVQAPTVTLGTDRTGAWQITANTTVQGDLARLARLVGSGSSETHPLSGALSGHVDLRPDEGRQVVQLDANVQNLTVGAADAPAWREPSIRISGQGVYDMFKDSFNIVQLHIEGQSVNGDAAGQLAALSSDKELSLQGKLTYDLEKLETQLQPYLGGNVKLIGRDSRPFHIAGALTAPVSAKSDLLGRLHGDAGLSWQSVQAMGCSVGKGELRGQLADGSLRIAPIDTTLNQGRLHLEPDLRLAPGAMELTLPKSRVVERARLTPATCAGALGYAVPAVANVAQAEGEFSLDIQNARVPLSDPSRADVAGWITIHSAQISAGPLTRELAVLLKGPPTLTLAKDNVVPFRMANGRVYHNGLELHFPELTIRTSGSVGLDGTLALKAEMPVPPKWLGSGKLAKVVGNPTVRLPIAGTLSEPKLDREALRQASEKYVRKAAENAIRRQLDGKLRKDAENGLKKLFRRR